MNKCKIKFTVDYDYAEKNFIIPAKEDKTISECQLEISGWTMKDVFTRLSLVFENPEKRDDFIEDFANVFDDLRYKKETTIYSVEGIGKMEISDGSIIYMLEFLVNTEIIEIDTVLC